MVFVFQIVNHTEIKTHGYKVELMRLNKMHSKFHNIVHYVHILSKIKVTYKAMFYKKLNIFLNVRKQCI